MLERTFVFRVDASTEIGTGHVMRCLTLADELRKNGASCVFVCKEHKGNLIDFVRARGFVVRAIDVMQGDDRKHGEGGGTSHWAWLGGAWQDDVAKTLQSIGMQQADWLIVDHYALDHGWESAIRKACRAVMVVDDLADRRHDCDLLLDQNLGRTAADYAALTSKNCKTLIGPRYALLRPEFVALRKKSLRRRSSGGIRQILVTMGGVDKDNVTGKVLAALTKANLPTNCKIIVVMGPSAPWATEIKRQAELIPLQVDIRENVTDMALLMAESDLAIGAAGSTSWERCCLGVPSIVLVLASNQEAVSRHLEDHGAALRISNSGCWQNELIEKIGKLVQDPDGLRTLSVEAAKLVDGQGVQRVVSAISAFGFAKPEHKK